MKNCVYGVDITKEVTPIMVRDAIICCFILAHKEILEEMKEYSSFSTKKEFDELKKINVEFLIRSLFQKCDGNFDNPCKEDIIKVISSLKDYSKNFRNDKIIEKHSSEIMELVNRLK